MLLAAPTSACSANWVVYRGLSYLASSVTMVTSLLVLWGGSEGRAAGSREEGGTWELYHSNFLTKSTWFFLKTAALNHHSIFTNSWLDFIKPNLFFLIIPQEKKKKKVRKDDQFTFINCVFPDILSFCVPAHIYDDIIQCWHMGDDRKTSHLLSCCFVLSSTCSVWATVLCAHLFTPSHCRGGCCCPLTHADWATLVTVCSLKASVPRSMFDLLLNNTLQLWQAPPWRLWETQQQTCCAIQCAYTHSLLVKEVHSFCFVLMRYWH